MDNPFLLLGIFIFFSFWWIDKSMANWKKEQDLKLEEIKEAIDNLSHEFKDKIN